MGTSSTPTRASAQIDAPTPGADASTAPRPVSAALTATVVLVTAIAPLATDMYVPAFPDVACDLGTSATGVQLTLTTFFTGMAAGQLIGGPFSDQRGCRRPCSRPSWWSCSPRSPAQLRRTSP